MDTVRKLSGPWADQPLPKRVGISFSSSAAAAAASSTTVLDMDEASAGGR